MKELYEAVVSYLDVARGLFQQVQQRARPQPAVQVLWSPTQVQREVVMAAEQSQAFETLVESVKASYASTHRLMTYGGETEKAMRSFFCRSGTYTSLFSSDGASPRITTDALQRAFSTTAHRVTYLAPLELVWFGADIIDCGRYRIQRFSSQELGVLLESHLREVFYQSSYIDTAALETYWFLVAEGTEPNPLCADPGRQEFESALDVSFSPYPTILENALRRFALFSWNYRVGIVSPKQTIEDYDASETSLSPTIPFFIMTSESLLVPPAEAPDVRVLLKDDLAVLYRLNETWTRDFEWLMQHIDHLVDVVRTHGKQWRFIELAMGFLLKGFLANGLESLLWNITAVEALLGERTDSGQTRRIATRLAKVLGKTKEEREKVAELFMQLYESRCALVHGDQRLVNSKAVKAHATQARDLACSLLLWMLSFLADVADKWKRTPGSLPTREQLLKVLDLAEGERDLFAKLLGGVPANFPCVSTWLDPGQLMGRWRTDHREKHPELHDPAVLESIRALFDVE